MTATGPDNNSELKASASVSTPDLGIDPHDCLAVEPSDPCTIVILGATGDLTARKLVPALFELYLEGGLPQPFQIMGCGRTGLSSQAFRSHLEKALINCQVLIFNQQIEGSIPNSNFLKQAEGLFKLYPDKIVLLDSRHYCDQLRNVSLKANEIEVARLNGIPAKTGDIIPGLACHLVNLIIKGYHHS